MVHGWWAWIESTLWSFCFWIRSWIFGIEHPYLGIYPTLSKGVLHRSRERTRRRFLWKYTVEMVWSFLNYMVWNTFGAMICQMNPELICTNLNCIMDTKSLSWTEIWQLKLHILVWPQRSSKVTNATQKENIKNDCTLTRMIPATGAKHPGAFHQMLQYRHCNDR